MPSPLDYIGPRRFAFYPAIRNADPNEWILGTGSRSEVQVINAQTGREIWVPRQHIGAAGSKRVTAREPGAAEPEYGDFLSLESGDRNHRNFSVERPMSASTTAMIQNRITI